MNVSVFEITELEVVKPWLPLYSKHESQACNAKLLNLIFFFKKRKERKRKKKERKKKKEKADQEWSESMIFPIYQSYWIY